MGRIVCLCNLVDDKKIVSVLKKGAISTSQVQKFSGAGTTCGRCLPQIDQLVSGFIKQKPKGRQKKLDFGF
jgi:bacterioferritin-associated ferredoxin